MMTEANRQIIEELKAGNEEYIQKGLISGDVSGDMRLKSARLGQHPKAIVITCSDSRVIPEVIFNTGIGELFVIRVAGNVLDNHQLGSIEYAASHLDANLIIMMGHTRCGAISAVMKSHGGTDRYIKYIMEDIRSAIGDEKNDYEATRLNALHGVKEIIQAFHEHPEIESDELDVVGAVYDIASGKVEWL
jgi:carbonic anhydrase